MRLCASATRRWNVAYSVGSGTPLNARGLSGSNSHSAGGLNGGRNSSTASWLGTSTTSAVWETRNPSAQTSTGSIASSAIR